MFTGLIEDIGHVHGLAPSPGGFRLRLTTALATGLAPGDSLAVNGVCLTVTDAADDAVSADIGPETARVTTLGGLQVGDRVNLERAMRADSRFGGHFVQGHVDAVATLAAVRPEGESHWLTVAFPAPLAGLFVPKGSVALDGISLTVAALAPASFDVMIIPFTWVHTNLSSRRPGDTLNLECDMVGKYVARSVALFGAAPPEGPDTR
jgi:riboflavin synthase